MASGWLTLLLSGFTLILTVFLSLHDYFSQAVLLPIAFVATFFLTLIAGNKLFEIISQRGCTLKVLSPYFRQKIWITIGTALYFVLLYAFTCYITIETLDLQTFLTALRYGMKHPTYFFGWALFFAICNALGLYLTRMIIKYFFLKKTLY